MKKLVNIVDISERLINVCDRYGFVYLNDLVRYGERNNDDFTKLRNCGKKTTDEILKLIGQFGKNGEDFISFEKSNDDKNVRYDVKIVLQYIESSKYELSVRALNTLRSIQVQVTSLELKSEEFFQSLNNCGNKTAIELAGLFRNIEFSNIEKYIQTNRSFLQNILSNNSSLNNVIEIFRL